MASGHYLPLAGNTSIGQRTLYGTWLPPGARVAAYVGPQSDTTDSYSTSSLLVSTLNAGLARCRSGKGDVVVVLPGHAENISTADFFTSLVAGTRIIGVGMPGQTILPTFTWTATASSFLLDVANVVLDNLAFDWTSVDGVVAPITVTGAGCTISNCKFSVQTASAGALKGVDVSTGANGFRFINNTMLGIGEAQPLTSSAVLVSAAVDDVEISDNYICTAGPGAATTGLIAVTAAATNVRIRRNETVNLETAGTALFTITVGDVAATGIISRNFCKITSAVTTTTSGVEVGTAALVGVGMFENYCTDTAEAQGVLAPTASS
jgi:hypothetical protein